MAPSGSLRSPLRVLGLLVCAAMWAVFIAMALRTSRYPVVFERYSREYATLLAIVLAIAAAITLTQVPRVYRALYARRHALLWVGVFCPLLVMGSIEGGMRMFNLLGSNFYGDIRRYMTVLQLDPSLYFKNPARYRGKYGGVEIATNEMGLRERGLWAHRAGERRVLVLGDSVAFGWGVPVQDAFPRQLERELRQSTGADYSTINSGVPGYNTGQELTFLRTYGDRLQPDAVVVLYVDNDIDAIDPARVHMGIMPNPWKDPRGAADYFLSMSHLYFMAHHIVPVLAGRVTATPAERRATAGWKQSMEALRDLARVCRERGTPLAVVHFRMLDDPISGALNSDIAEVAREERFEFADALPWYAGRNIRMLTNSFIDTHPNAQGHAILAKGTARFLLAGGGAMAGRAK